MVETIASYSTNNDQFESNGIFTRKTHPLLGTIMQRSTCSCNPQKNTPIFLQIDFQKVYNIVR